MENSIVLLTTVDSNQAKNPKQTARQNAQLFFREHMVPADYTYVKEVHAENTVMPVTPFDSPKGENLVEEYLEATRNNRRQKIKEVQKRIRNEDIDKLIGDRDFEYLSRHLHGRTNSRSNKLIDGTLRAKGEMIASEDILNKVVTRAESKDMKLFAVQMTCRF